MWWLLQLSWNRWSVSGVLFGAITAVLGCYLYDPALLQGRGGVLIILPATVACGLIADVLRLTTSAKFQAFAKKENPNDD